MTKHQPLFMLHLRAYALEIAIAFVVVSAIIFLFLYSFFYVAPYQAAPFPEYDKYFQEDVATQEYKRLAAYHGYPDVVIFEPGKTPFFINKAGKKCKFIYPKGRKNNG